MTTTPPDTKRITEPDFDLVRRIQKWSFRRGCRKKLNDGTPDYGTVSQAAKLFKSEPKYIADLIGRCGTDNSSPYFFWFGPDDDYSKMRFDHDGE